MHLYAFVSHTLWKYNEPKYYEYVLHHGLAVVLLFFSYMANLHVIGSLVLIVHDPGDVVLIMARSYSDYKWRRPIGILVVYGLCYSVWIFTRITMFPLCIIKNLW